MVNEDFRVMVNGDALRPPRVLITLIADLYREGVRYGGYVGTLTDLMLAGY